MSLIKRAIIDNLQPFISRPNDLFTRQHNVYVEVLTMIFRALLCKRARFALDHREEKIIPVDGIFAGRQ
ncbi:hypothetical protein D3C76_1863820 [compost metagenome]